MLKIPSKRRNPVLADIFSRLKYMERRGSGFKKILADYEGQVEFDETKMPVFEADNDDFTLILYNLNYGSNYATQVNENVIENVIEIFGFSEIIFRISHALASFFLEYSGIIFLIFSSEISMTFSMTFSFTCVA